MIHFLSQLQITRFIKNLSFATFCKTDYSSPQNYRAKIWFTSYYIQKLIIYLLCILKDLTIYLPLYHKRLMIFLLLYPKRSMIYLPLYPNGWLFTSPCILKDKRLMIYVPLLQITQWMEMRSQPLPPSLTHWGHRTVPVEVKDWMKGAAKR